MELVQSLCSLEKENKVKKKYWTSLFLIYSVAFEIDSF